MTSLRKYPRTPHILDSALQPGDEDIPRAGFAAIAGRELVVEEKIDGANSAISFDAAGRLLLQSRGHYLTGGPRERHFARLKAWASDNALTLQATLGDRYVVYGEWTYAKHTIFYDALPNHFLEFDILDRVTGEFLSTRRRRHLLTGLPFSSVPVLHEGPIASAMELRALVGRSAFKTGGWRDTLARLAAEAPHSADFVLRQTDPSDLMEGLYIKVEDEDRVIARFKYVRHDFLTAVFDSESHWQSRPILPNLLAAQTRRLGSAEEES